MKFDTWVQRITGVPMEPRAAVAEFDPDTGRYTLYAGSGAWSSRSNGPPTATRRSCATTRPAISR